MKSRQRFLAALAGDAVDRPPVWLMRQAGRFLPDYRAVRAQHGFWDVCKTPALSTKVALEPLARFPIDAAIVFSDILVVPDALGLDVAFGKGEGPLIGRPLRTRADLDAWNRKGVMDRLAFVPAALRHLRDTLAGSHGLVGFAGAPFTLFAYMVEGGSSDDFRQARLLLEDQPALATDAFTVIADIVGDLLAAQFEAGADIVQLFDTWGGLLPRTTYERFCVPALRRICDRLLNKRVMLYIKGGQHLLPLIPATGVSGVSIDWRSDWSEARALLPNHVLQGNIDPVILLGSADTVRRETSRVLDAMAKSGSTKNIVNLGHGILPETPVENVMVLTKTVEARA